MKRIGFVLLLVCSMGADHKTGIPVGGLTADQITQKVDQAVKARRAPKKIVPYPPNPGMTVTYRDNYSSRPTRSREEYVHFSQETQKVIDKMVEVTVSEREKADLRILAHSLRKYNEAVNADNYNEADYIRERMQPFLVRGGNVAAVSGKRKADLARADEERRHREAMRQRERQHREAMRQQERLQQEQLIRLQQLNQLKQNPNRYKSNYGPSPGR